MDGTTDEDECPLIYEEPILVQELKRSEFDDGAVTTIYGYRACWKRSTLTWINVALSLGLLYLLFHWQPRWRLICTHVRCPLSVATKILILETYQGKWKSYYIKSVTFTTMQDHSKSPKNSYQNKNYDEDPSEHRAEKTFTVYLDDGSRKEVYSYRSFRCKKLTYIWDDDKNCFLKMVGLEKYTTCAQYHTIKGYSLAEQARMRVSYGINEIQVPVQSILVLLVLEFFNPFYVFQVFTIAVWLAENYYYYCVAIVIMSVFGISTSVIQTRKNQSNLKSTVQSVGNVQVCRNKSTGEVDEICSSDLVPGDVIVIPPHGCTMHVDAVLLDGSCIVNESMLTGESVPVTKTALPLYNRPYDLKGDASHTLYCGTKVIQTRYYKNESVKAVVLRTGFLTTKGHLVRSIMYPLPADFKFDRDSYKFIIILTVIAALGLLYTILIKISREITTAGDIVIKSLDIITIVIPPALPAAMTVGRLYAISRLKRAGVFCINPRVINVSGSTSCVCFDKTGTLTEDGLDMWGVVSVRTTERHKGLIRDNVKRHDEKDEDDPFEDLAEFDVPIRDPSVLKDDDLLKIGMNVCHSLTILSDELTGDPIDVKMFESTGWILEEPKVPDNTKYDLLVPTVVKPPIRNGNVEPLYEWGIVQQYQFNSSLQRCSVICKSIHSKNYMAFCKGSPEMIAALSISETVPHSLKTTLRKYTQQGYRVLALACRPLQDDSFLRIQRLTREQVETELIFLGLVVLENRLKPESSQVIAELREAHIKVVMITGDNLDTAVSVAAECGILSKDERLIICETVQSDINFTPEIYYTSSMINIEGLKRSKAVNPPTVAKISISEGSVSNFGTASSDVKLCLASTNSSSSTINCIENGILNNNYKIAMIGSTWKVLKEYYPDLIPKLITRGIIFARMSSDQKQQLVQELQALGYYVGMCGDGANDCGALKTAHVGISVSGQESSVASPFTSRESHVGCVPLVIKEGRAALITSFGMFKFMVAYSMCEFVSVAILYYFESNLTDFQFLYIDIVLIVNFAFFFGKTHAYPGRLFKIPPGTSLLSFVPLFSLISHMIIVTAFQVVAYLILFLFSWYEPHTYQGDIAYLSHENYGIFCVSMFQYIALAVAFSQGKPYRKAIWTNWVFMASLLTTTVLAFYITVYPADWLINLLELKMPPDYDYRYIVVGLGALSFITCLFVEKVIVQYAMQEKQWLPAKLREDSLKSNSYHSIEKELNRDSDWPPVATTGDGQTPCIIEDISENAGGRIHGNGTVLNSETIRVPESIIDVIE